MVFVNNALYVHWNFHHADVKKYEYFVIWKIFESNIIISARIIIASWTYCWKYCVIFFSVFHLNGVRNLHLEGYIKCIHKGLLFLSIYVIFLEIDFNRSIESLWYMYKDLQQV